MAKHPKHDTVKLPTGPTHNPPLTARQAEVLAVLERSIQSRGYPPTIREMGTELGIRSPQGVSDHLAALERKGYIHRTASQSRSCVPVAMSDDTIEIPESELKVDVFRSSGPGGQSVNTTDSAVRITHIPTGIVVSMQNEKSQIQNRAAALRVLQARLLVVRQQEQKAEMDALKGEGSSWGNQMRSYVLHPYQMVKDLRTEQESGNPGDVLDGGIDSFIEAGIRWRRQQEAPAA